MEICYWTLIFTSLLFQNVSPNPIANRLKEIELDHNINPTRKIREVYFSISSPSFNDSLSLPQPTPKLAVESNSGSSLLDHNTNGHIEHIGSPETPPEDKQLPNIPEDMDDKSRGPIPYDPSPQPAESPLSQEDKTVRDAWGGSCLSKDWRRCSKIEAWGGDYSVPDKKNPGQFIIENKLIPCFSETEKYYCLSNGWTVARCHLLCMSQCNQEYSLNYDQLVLYEGQCNLPIG